MARAMGSSDVTEVSAAGSAGASCTAASSSVGAQARKRIEIGTRVLESDIEGLR
jgi:hypothetical protein